MAVATGGDVQEEPPKGVQVAIAGYIYRDPQLGVAKEGAKTRDDIAALLYLLFRELFALTAISTTMAMASAATSITVLIMGCLPGRFRGQFTIHEQLLDHQQQGNFLFGVLAVAGPVARRPQRGEMRFPPFQGRHRDPHHFGGLAQRIIELPVRFLNGHGGGSPC